MIIHIHTFKKDKKRVFLYFSQKCKSTFRNVVICTLFLEKYSVRNRDRHRKTKKIVRRRWWLILRV